MQPSYPEEMTTKLPLFVSIPLEYVMAAAPLAMTIPTLALTMLASLLATRLLVLSSGAFSLILLRTRLALHTISAIAAVPYLVLAFVPCMYFMKEYILIRIQIPTVQSTVLKFNTTVDSIKQF